MAKAKKGDLFSCTECGLVVVVDEACGCASAEIVCCEQPMAKGKSAADKAKKKAAALPAPPKSVSAKKGKASVAKKAASAKPKAKGTVKKAPPKKAPAAKK